MITARYTVIGCRCDGCGAEWDERDDFREPHGTWPTCPGCGTFMWRQTTPTRGVEPRQWCLATVREVELCP